MDKYLLSTIFGWFTVFYRSGVTFPLTFPFTFTFFAPTITNQHRTKMKTAMFDAKGLPTAYAHRCGTIEKTANAHLVWEYTCYHVRGFNAKGERVYLTTKRLAEARKMLRATA